MSLVLRKNAKNVGTRSEVDPLISSMWLNGELNTSDSMNQMIASICSMLSNKDVDFKERLTAFVRYFGNFRRNPNIDNVLVEKDMQEATNGFRIMAELSTMEPQMLHEIKSMHTTGQRGALYTISQTLHKGGMSNWKPGGMYDSSVKMTVESVTAYYAFVLIISVACTDIRSIFPENIRLNCALQLTYDTASLPLQTLLCIIDRLRKEAGTSMVYDISFAEWLVNIALSLSDEEIMKELVQFIRTHNREIINQSEYEILINRVFDESFHDSNSVVYRKADYRTTDGLTGPNTNFNVKALSYVDRREANDISIGFSGVTKLYNEDLYILLRGSKIQTPNMNDYKTANNPNSLLARLQTIKMSLIQYIEHHKTVTNGIASDHKHACYTNDNTYDDYWLPPRKITWNQIDDFTPATTAIIGFMNKALGTKFENDEYGLILCFAEITRLSVTQTEIIAAFNANLSIGGVSTGDPYATIDVLKVANRNNPNNFSETEYNAALNDPHMTRPIPGTLDATTLRLQEVNLQNARYNSCVSDLQFSPATIARFFDMHGAKRNPAVIIADAKCSYLTVFAIIMNAYGVKSIITCEERTNQNVLVTSGLAVHLDTAHHLSDTKANMISETEKRTDTSITVPAYVKYNRVYAFSGISLVPTPRDKRVTFNNERPLTVLADETEEKKYCKGNIFSVIDCNMEDVRTKLDSNTANNMPTCPTRYDYLSKIKSKFAATAPITDAAKKDILNSLGGNLHADANNDAHRVTTTSIEQDGILPTRLQSEIYITVEIATKELTINSYKRPRYIGWDHYLKPGIACLAYKLYDDGCANTAVRKLLPNTQISDFNAYLQNIESVHFEETKTHDTAQCKISPWLSSILVADIVSEETVFSAPTSIGVFNSAYLNQIKNGIRPPF